MSHSASINDYGVTNAQKNRALVSVLIACALWTGVFLGGFVIFEPAPHEIFMVGLIGIAVLFGLKIPRATMPLIFLLMMFNIGGLITLMITPNMSNYFIYVAVSFFLAFTAIFYAAIIAADPSRLKIIFSAYTIAAVLTGTLGILGYFGAIPNAELFTRFDRAKGAFQDPNVLAPYLCLPALYCLHQVLTCKIKDGIFPLITMLVLLLALFLSFSRAGWGMFVICSIMLVGALLISNPSTAFRMRITLLAAVAVIFAISALVIALQFEAVRDIFLVRAQLVQDYDGARLGRFARHGIGFLMATENPLGIGILQFGEIFAEEPHNTWLKALMSYSWLGFAAYVSLVIWTLAAGLKILFRNRIWQPFLLCAYLVFIGHVIIGNVIDTDHWRHFFLLLGIIWGCIAAEDRFQRT